jgi:glycosyltransferase involved in cell wall biosynthesis
MDRTYSVVIPAYDAAETIGEAIASLLDQSEPPAAIIVVDDGSNDRTAEAASAASPLVRVIRQQNAGCGRATNAGVDAVSTLIVAFLDADDLWLPQKARLQLDRLEADPGLSGLFAKGRTFKGSASAPNFGPLVDLWVRTTLLMRAELARRIGPLADDLPGNMGELVDWIARGREMGMRFELMDADLAMRRIRPGSLSYTLDAEKRRGYLMAAKRALDRRRAAADDRSGS